MGHHVLVRTVTIKRCVNNEGDILRKTEGDECFHLFEITLDNPVPDPLHEESTRPPTIPSVKVVH